MSQAGIVDIIDNNPQIPIVFQADVGTASAILNVIKFNGTSVQGITSSASGNTIVYTIADAANAQKGVILTSDNATTIAGASSTVAVVPSSLNAKLGSQTANAIPYGAGSSSALSWTSALTSGQFAIGSATVPTAGKIVSPNATITIGYVFPNITIDLEGGGEGIDSIAVQTGTNPVIPNISGLVTFNGATVAAGTNPVRTDGTGANTVALEVQISQAIAAADATKIGLSNFNSSHFSVDSNGFVAFANPSGFPWTDVTSATQTLAINHGYITDHSTTVTYTLPATASIGDTILIVGKLGTTIIAQNANQQIVMSSASSTVGVTGQVAGTNVGDCITLIAIVAGASTIWRANNFVGNWTVT